MQTLIFKTLRIRRTYSFGRSSCKQYESTDLFQFWLKEPGKTMQSTHTVRIHLYYYVAIWHTFYQNKRNSRWMIPGKMIWKWLDVDYFQYRNQNCLLFRRKESSLRGMERSKSVYFAYRWNKRYFFESDWTILFSVLIKYGRLSPRRVRQSSNNLPRIYDVFFQSVYFLLQNAHYFHQVIFFLNSFSSLDFHIETHKHWHHFAYASHWRDSKYLPPKWRINQEEKDFKWKRKVFTAEYLIYTAIAFMLIGSKYVPRLYV